MSRSAIVPAACAISLALGLFFIFVWAPHPWGWEGFDHYHQLALTLAAGQPFPTMEVPWGYAYFAAAFYRVFGDRPWILLVAQALLNAAMPWLVYQLALEWTNQRTAIVAAVITGIFSFNTIYASTQSSDAVCTVLFMTAVLAFVRARRADSVRGFALVGVLTGVATQFRPNLILIPAVLAGFAVFERHSGRRLLQAAVLLFCAGITLVPWVARNHRLTGMVLPTSVHGGVQLWYGTLQVGPYLRSRAYNPRSVFEAPVFPYTSLEDLPIVVEGELTCDAPEPAEVFLTYWTDRDGTRRRLMPSHAEARHYTFEIPAPHRDTVVYYYLATVLRGDTDPVVQMTPANGERFPSVYFVTDRHLGDLDVHGDLLDIFDVVRLARHGAWGDQLPFADGLRSAGILTAKDASAALMEPLLKEAARHSIASIDHDETTIRMTFSDGSTIVIPRTWNGSITELTITGSVASTLMSTNRSLRALAAHEASKHRSYRCSQFIDVAANQLFYRREPHLMRRYSALALDNMRREPGPFVLASLYRAARLFIIQGTSDRMTAHQFEGSRRVYVGAQVISLTYVVLLVIGMVVALRRYRHAIVLPLLLIAYVPATLAPVLTNMRYTVTIQPLIFIFVAIAVSAIPRTARDPAPVSSPFAG
jgi:Dolichyl-phosphate-mannose-protein mannosyltransferase